MYSIRFRMLLAVMLGLGTLALSTACIVPVYEYDGWGYRHRYHRDWRDDGPGERHDRDHDVP